ncbi:hypothetical protein B0A48_09374 [Cryoendolithus antarcticus]|uniref:Flavin reductase like domain-containing protein n=1 Tax=Cryoendolithus antarcticus TaxID=1507870 RepID=A0A1V8SZX6_9PEZI|nr:hypothetical protein B0A48_09374 [Cryoendolithus antarcticus]
MFAATASLFRDTFNSPSPFTIYPFLEFNTFLSPGMVFYEPGKTSHGLPRDPFKACVVPRPIGWLSTRSPTGVDNLAPYSQFNNLTFDPPYVMFAANENSTGTRKDSVVNAETTGVFGWNVATWDLREAVNASAELLGPEVDEFEKADLEKEEAKLIGVSLVKRSPVRFECSYYTTLRLPGSSPSGSTNIVIGRVIAVHISDSVITDGKVDIGKVQPIARCGYYEYAVIRPDAVFEMIIPGDQKNLAGLEGNAGQIKALEDKEADDAAIGGLRTDSKGQRS